VRIVAGAAKGTRLAPVPAGTRPMSDRAREGLFSSLGGTVEEARVLDLFAGSGAIGMEALSRGAESALLVDSAPGAIKAINENLRRTKLARRGKARRADALRAVRDRPGPFDLVVLLTLSNTVQNAIIGDDNSVTGGILGATTLLAVNYLVVRFLYGHERLERLVEGEADVLIDGGQIRFDRLRKELVTLPELESAAHKQGFASLDEVERAVLEPGGTLAFFGKKPNPEATRHAEVTRRLDRILEELASLRMRPAT